MPAQNYMELAFESLKIWATFVCLLTPWNQKAVHPSKPAIFAVMALRAVWLGQESDTEITLFLPEK